MTDYKELIDGLQRLEFFNQRAGRELWADKTHDVQERDIESAQNILLSAIGTIEQLVADNESYKCALADLHNEIANYCETIATLEKERDAAVADLKGHCRCSDCKHLDANNRCKENHSCFDANHWEWRGAMEDNDEID